MTPQHLYLTIYRIVIVGDGDNKTTVVTNSEISTVDGRAGILALDHNGHAAFMTKLLPLRGKD